jgi:hypothetical protein
MIKEIGGECWNLHHSNNIIQVPKKDALYLLSGRTALDFIIKDRRTVGRFKSVYMPSYCCHSMIEPFLSNGVEVYFYDVLTDQQGNIIFDINYEFDCDAIYIMQYFGFQQLIIEKIAKEFSDRNITIIEDITHSMYTNRPHSDYADYIYSSLRKWNGLYTGGFAKKVKNQFMIEMPSSTNKNYVEIREKAFQLKKQYMEYNRGAKEEYLNLFHSAEEYLEKDYRGYLMDPSSYSAYIETDTKVIRQKRLDNANRLLDGISNKTQVQMIFKSISQEDAPMFLPVLIPLELRERFKQYLINHSIYCPVHWPLSEFHRISSDSKLIYGKILSLVCDQRYGEEEIKYMIKVINKF